MFWQMKLGGIHVESQSSHTFLFALVGVTSNCTKGSFSISHTAWGTNRRNYRSVCSHRTTVSSGSQRCAGIAHVTECCHACRAAGMGMGEEPTENLWGRISWQINLAEVVVGFCYRPPDQEEEVDEAAFRQLEEASLSQAMFLMVGFQPP